MDTDELHPNKSGGTMWGGWCGVVGVVSEVVDMLLCWQRISKEATPVTLACEDDQRLEANKVILAATSPFFGRYAFRKKTYSPTHLLEGFSLNEN